LSFGKVKTSCIIRKGEYMHITELSLDTQNFQEQYLFYTDILGLPLREKTPKTFTVQAGTTSLTFRETTRETGYHFAFTIPSNKFADAKAWLVTRVPLLTQNDQDEFFFEGWNAGSFYFRDKANHILELIAHYDLPNEKTGAFGAADLLYISEIGLVFEEVPEWVKTLNAEFHIEPYRNPIEEAFAVLGDISGMFINVKIDRNWFPTNTRALVSPVDVTIEDVKGHSQQLVPYPYHVSVR
jgi:catechol 2,3-dioxygenase-like lactoylglutathione lyase family enzyme